MAQVEGSDTAPTADEAEAVSQNPAKTLPPDSLSAPADIDNLPTPKPTSGDSGVVAGTGPVLRVKVE
jgi:hypothetical protein